MSLFTVFWTALIVTAMPVKTQVLKSRAYFQPAEGNLLEALDLKMKTVTFTNDEMEQCQQNLKRLNRTLTYHCTFTIPGVASKARLRNIASKKEITVNLGQRKQKVFVLVSDDARQVTFTTGFDVAGIDFEMARFNRDLAGIYRHAAWAALSQAMSAEPLQLEVLEGR